MSLGSATLDTSQVIEALRNVRNEYVSVFDTMSKMARGNDLSKYFKSQADSLEDVIHAFRRFDFSGSIEDASEALKSFNAFKALEGQESAIKDAIGNFDDLYNEIKKVSGGLNEAFSTRSFQEAFAVFKKMQDFNISSEDLFGKIKAPDTNEMMDELEAAREKIRELTAEMQKLGDVEGFHNLEKQLEQANQRLEESEQKIINIRTRAVQEFKNYLKANELGGKYLNEKPVWGDMDGSSAPLQEYYENIRSGYDTAREAIARFNGEYTELLRTTQSSVDLNVAPMIAEVGNKAEESTGKIQQQTEAIESFTGTGNEMQNVANGIVTAISNISDGTEEAATKVEHIKEIIQAVSDLQNIDGGKLRSISNVVSAIGMLNKISVGGKSVEHIKGLLTALDSIKNVDALNTITQINFHGFKDLSISKTPLANLATYLPQIAGVNVEQLQKLAGISWANLNELKPGKAAMDNLKGLVESMSGGNAIKESVDQLGTTIAESMQNIKIPITPQNFTGIEEAAIFIAQTISEAITNAMAGAGSKAGGESTFVHPVIESLRVMKKELEQTGAALKSMGTDDPFGTEQLAKFNSLSEQLNRKIRDATKGQDVTTDYIGKEIHSLSEVVAAHKKAADEREKAANQKAAAAKKEADEEEKAAKRAEKAQEKASINAERQKAAGDIAAAKTSVNKLLKEGYGADNYNADAVSHVREEYAKLLDMVAQLANADSEQYKNAVPGLIEQAQKVKDLADAENNAAKAHSDAAKVDASRLQLLDQVNKFMEEGSDAAQQNAQQLQELAAALEKPGQSADDIARLKKQFDELQKSEKNASKEMNGFVKGFDSILNRFTAANLVVKGFDWLVKQCKEMVTAVKEVDAAMTELKKVTDLTSEGYSQFYNNAVQTAQTIGASVSDTINASAD